MITTVDTNILLDILIPDEVHSIDSKNLLDTHIEKGQLVICEVVYAELASQFPSEEELKAFLTDTGIMLVYSNEKALNIAGQRWVKYIRNKKRILHCPQCGEKIMVVCPQCRYPFVFRQRIISDFIIGAHALVNSEVLLTRDRGFYKTYFKDLKINIL